MQTPYQLALNVLQEMRDDTTISEYQSQPKPKKDTVGLTFTDPFAWAIGIFEGEGCLTYCKTEDKWEMKVEMTDMDVLWSFYEAIGCVGNLNGLRKRPSRKENWKPLVLGKQVSVKLIHELVHSFLPLHARTSPCQVRRILCLVSLQKMKLLIDADFIVYKCCAAAEDEIDWGDDVITVVSKFSEALHSVERESLSKIKEHFMWDIPEVILFFSDSKNFRKKIYPDYKGHRNRKKPCGYRRVISELSERYKVVRIPELEADDAMGIYATFEPGNIIVSPDKDMRQIPGKLYNLDETVEVSEEEGMRWHLIQTLAGDQTDGYGGVPGIGVKRAIALLDKGWIHMGHSCQSI